MRLRVYIAGPISKGDINHNIQQARDAGVALIKAGFAPLVPQLSCFMGGNEPLAGPCGISHQEWLDMDFPWVAASHAVLRLPGESVGADMEVRLAQSLGIPVYDSVDTLVANPPVQGDARFHGLLRRMGALHDQKQRDYGRVSDPFSNVRASAEIGIEPWLGAWLRARDKVKRIDTYCLKRTLANEGVEDSFMDLAVYCLIALLLHQDGEAAKELAKDAS